jgi:DNA modification methylase
MKSDTRSRSLFLPRETTRVLAEAARDKTPIAGWTHNFYRYPARFSPQFAGQVIELFSQPGGLVLDPFMGGGTAVIEALAAGRRIVGNDLNSLAAFIAKVKTTPLRAPEVCDIKRWALETVPQLNYRFSCDLVAPYLADQKLRNMNLPSARFIKKVIAASLVTIDDLHSSRARDFARCAVLRVAQTALDGRKSATSVDGFRRQLTQTTLGMLNQLRDFCAQVKLAQTELTESCWITNVDASKLEQFALFAEQKVSLVVTSPPYPGVHVLYHRWQIKGRRETPAPYWIANTNDGQGVSYYNLGDRRDRTADKYFGTLLEALRSIRRVMAPDAFMVQMLAFNAPAQQLPRYLANMETAGFMEVLPDEIVCKHKRIWRDVPNRKWHATIKGRTSSSREVVLIHRVV